MAPAFAALVAVAALAAVVEVTAIRSLGLVQPLAGGSSRAVTMPAAVSPRARDRGPNNGPVGEEEEPAGNGAGDQENARDSDDRPQHEKPPEN